MPEKYDGVERRKDYIALEAAMNEVEHLHGAVTTLATAVTNTVPRQELINIRDEVSRDFKYKLYVMVALTITAVAALMFSTEVRVNNTREKFTRDHGIIMCLLQQPEANRTGTSAATALVTCEQTVK